MYPKVFEKSNNQLKNKSFASIIPVIILFSTISLFGIFSDVNGVYPAMVLSIIYFMIVHRDMDALNRGVMNAFAPLIYTASSMDLAM